jgi:hypothetical protein
MMPKVGDVVVFGNGRGDARVVSYTWGGRSWDGYWPDGSIGVLLHDDSSAILIPDGTIDWLDAKMRKHKKWRML